MSIYPVRLAEWYSPPNEQFDTCLMIVATGLITLFSAVIVFCDETKYFEDKK